jgi:hypothetical protein
MKIHLTRDSVCAADDVDAPHTRTMSFADEMPLDSVIDEISRSGYLASIVGGKATWSVVAGQPIAVIAQQWSQPKFLPDHATNLSLLKGADGVTRVHFRYHVQDDPNTVFATLRGQHIASGAA